MAAPERKRSRPPSPGSPSRTPVYVVLAIVAGAAAVALALRLEGGEGGTDQAGAAPCTYTPVPGFVDLHGLAVNPSRPEELYAATHHGLFRALNDTDWARVGGTQDDLMGFSMHPSDGNVVWSSGHPRSGGNMGIRLSVDGGCTWKRIALDGVDFHAMTVSPADPDRLWGIFAGKLYASRDRGHEWTVASAQAPRAYSLAADPRDAGTVYAATGLAVLRSADGGATWSTFRGGGASTVVAFSPADASVALMTFEGRLEKSMDGGASWNPLALDVHGGTIGFIAFHPTDPATAYVATYETGIWKTMDGGASWGLVRAPAAGGHG